MARAFGRILAFALAAGCSVTGYQAKFTPPSEPAAIDRDAAFLKCHLKSGHVVVFGEGWNVDVAGGEVRGNGIGYDMERHETVRGPIRVALENVVLIETNRPEAVPREGLSVLAFVTGISLGVTAVCIASPKTCFGSCPTFYADDGSGDAMQAEGFSASVARAFEATDVDAMWTARPRGRTFDVLMTNEALETHAVDSVRVLAVPRPAGARVLRAGETYFPAHRMHAPLACAAQRGSCVEDVSAIDGREYRSAASATDLTEKELIDLTFPASAGRRGIVVAARNTLLETFLFYQGLAFMGRRAGEWLAHVEQGTHEGVMVADAIRGMFDVLGDIEIEVESPSGWKRAGAFAEVGPIAREVQLVLLPDETPSRGTHVRITMTRGHWKLDAVALAELGEPVAPIALDPVRVTRNGAPSPEALAKLLEPGARLFTYPRDAYGLVFELPEGDHELFLESRGYYYEWIRDEWLADESAVDLARLMLDPRSALRRLAPKYKAIEADVDRIFWSSRFGRPR